MERINDRFNFYLNNVSFPFYEMKTTKELLTKWSMSDGMQFQGYSFDRPFKNYLKIDFVQVLLILNLKKVDFFTNQNVISTLLRATENHSFVPLGIPGETIRMKEIPCTQISMSFFDRLTEEGGIARGSCGSIKKCLNEYFKSYNEDGKIQNEIEISDELRKMLLMEDDSDAGDLFSSEEKDEFLFHIFQHLVIGGSLCQFEDYIHPYLNITKGFYKDLVSVVANTKTNDNNDEISTTSTVIQILSATCDSFETGKNLIFQNSQYNNFFYLVIDPNKRTCYTWYHHV